MQICRYVSGVLLTAFMFIAGCDGGSQKAAPAAQSPTPSTNTEASTNMSMHDFTMKDIWGADKPLADFKGKVALVVNVASKCGYTPQYEGLEKLHETYAAKGLVVLGFPANDFGAQEPGTDSEIATFCTSKYGVKFPMFSKITVKGGDKHPLYAFLTQAAPAGEVKWNFEKFLVGKDGRVIARYPSSVAPEDSKLIQAIEAALGS